ncbi:TNFAIP3-interacting protein 1-like [Melanotaenia boesemani]|uniref:TNFAIP3-interacting protein 1-like n=1 Tax=Melanotaenia boesemani TaxID=1250792 RepID=UPI001C0534FB|nr:TNFAIP3-interacting protein 1-like [Melanotaenia boesemani]
MSLHEKSMDRSPVKTPQFADVQQVYRLYPSLPNTNKYEICLPVGSTCDELNAAAEINPHALCEDSESEESSKSDDVSMKAQILILEEQRKELLTINKKWAKEYRTMVQYYKDKVRVLKASQQLDHSEEEMSDEGEKHVRFNEKLKVKTDTQTGENSELLTAQKEAKELRVQNSTLTRRGQHQHEEIKRLNKALEEALQATQPLGGSNEAVQDIWKHQAEVYKEDFLRERKDREKLKEKYLELESRFRKGQDELRFLKSQVSGKQPVHRCSCTNRAKCPNREPEPGNQQHIQLQRRYKMDGKH